MKKILAVIIIIILAFSVVACGETDDSSLNTSENAKHTYINTTETITTYETSSATNPTPTEAPATVHKHTFREATCTSPKTCTSCGETDGSAKGHNWKDATCSEPKTCTVCGNTSGLTAGHDFYDGECTHCGKADPDYIRETMVWIPNSGAKYHSRSSCSNMKNPSHVTKSYAESCGYTPCQKCH